MEAQRREEAELQKELKSVEQNVQQKRHQAAEYERQVIRKHHTSYIVVSKMQDQVCTLVQDLLIS